VRHASFAGLSGQETREGFAERSDKTARFFRDGRAGQWRTALTPAQAARVLARHGVQMARFGYAAAR
jgi:ornithine cyclodeaminase/alanine dehydrogenase-like protein (mu-crystallin family)